MYNAYHARSKTETWEKRLTCISWMFGCYKTMMQQVDGRQTPTLMLIGSTAHHVGIPTMHNV